MNFLPLGHSVRSLVIKTAVHREEVNLLKKPKKTLLRDILQYAASNIQFYQSRLPRNINLIINSDPVEALRFFPVLTKDMIRSYSSELISKSTTNSYWNSSGGSTGEPISILQDRAYLRINRYLAYNEMCSMGYTYGDRWMKIWGDERELLHHTQTPLKKIGIFVNNLKLVNSFRLSPSVLKEAIEYLNKYKPSLLVGYTQSIHELAKFSLETDIKVTHNIPVICTAGMLYPDVVQLIANTFGSSIYNRYGSREVGSIAFGAAGQDMAISRSVWLDTINDQEQVIFDKDGAITVTSLCNYAMPIIKYKIGDYGTMSYQTPIDNDKSVILSKLKGRIVDTFVNINGELIDGEYFTHLLYGMKWVRRFQFIQTSYSHIDFLVEVINDPPDNDLDHIRRGVATVMGNTCTLTYRKVSSIPPPPSGKYRYTMSHILR